LFSAQCLDRSYELVFPGKSFIFGGIIRSQVRNRSAELFEKSTSVVQFVAADVGLPIRPGYSVGFKRMLFRFFQITNRKPKFSKSLVIEIRCGRKLLSLLP